MGGGFGSDVRWASLEAALAPSITRSHRLIASSICFRALAMCPGNHETGGRHRPHAKAAGDAMPRCPGTRVVAVGCEVTAVVLY